MSLFVYNFIEKMSKREKASFRSYSEIHGQKSDKNYLQLYNFLESQKKYDAEKLHSHFQNSSIGKYLSSELNYLFEQLQRSLINFHFNSSTQNKLQKEVLFANLLMERGFRKKAMKTLVKAKKTAYEFEDFTIVLGLIELEEEILFQAGILGFTEKLYELQRERDSIAKKIENLNALRILREQIRELQFLEGYVDNPSDYPQIFNNPLLVSENKALSIKAREHWYYIKDFVFYLRRQYNDSVQVSIDYLAFVESNIKLFRTSKLLPLLSNFLHNCLLANNYSQFKIALARLDSLRSDKSLNLIYVLYIRHTRVLDMLYKQLDLEGTAKELHVVVAYANQHVDSLKITQAEYIIRLIVRSCILIQEPKKALPWVQMLYGNRAMDYTLYHARIYTLIIYYELRWLQNLESEVDASVKILKKKMKYNKLSRSFVTFFKSFLKKPDHLDVALDKLISKLEELSEDPKENFPFEHFDYLNWGRQLRLNRNK